MNYCQAFSLYSLSLDTFGSLSVLKIQFLGCEKIRSFCHTCIFQVIKQIITKITCVDTKCSFLNDETS